MKFKAIITLDETLVKAELAKNMNLTPLDYAIREFGWLEESGIKLCEIEPISESDTLITESVGNTAKTETNVLCIKSYVEDDKEYWTEGTHYKAYHNGDTWEIETNFGGMGCVGDAYLLDDFSEFFTECKSRKSVSKTRNTKITYLYRDGSNYKKYNEVVLAGEMTPAHLERIAKCLYDDEYFVPRSVGLPETRIDDFRTDDDHCWFELELCQNESDEWDLTESGIVITDEQPTVEMTVEELVSNFESVKSWDETSWMQDYPYKSFS